MGLTRIYDRGNMKKIAALIMAVGLVLGVTSGPAMATTSNHKVTICHATNSKTNPYVTITVDTHSTSYKGHLSHADDIIPAPAGGCSEVVTPTPPTPPANLTKVQGSVYISDHCGLDRDEVRIYNSNDHEVGYTGTVDRSDDGLRWLVVYEAKPGYELVGPTREVITLTNVPCVNPPGDTTGDTTNNTTIINNIVKIIHIHKHCKVAKHHHHKHHAKKHHHHKGKPCVKKHHHKKHVVKKPKKACACR